MSSNGLLTNHLTAAALAFQNLRATAGAFSGGLTSKDRSFPGGTI